MIFRIYKQLEKIVFENFTDIVKDSKIIYSYAGRARKVRIELIDQTFIDIWYSVEGDYSFHWEQRHIRNQIYRHDNAPHKKWKYIQTYPKHCHNGSNENVIESNLSDSPEQAITEFLVIVRSILSKTKIEKEI